MKPKQKLLLFLGILTLGILIIVTGILDEQSITQGGMFGLTLFFLIIVTEVVIAPIPGGVIGFLGAATYGFWTAWPIMYLGNIIGCIISFHLARHLGKPFVDKVTSKKQRVKWTSLFEKNRGWLFAAYSVPLIPIDVLSILAGFTHYKFKTFIMTVAPALLFYTAIVAYLGSRFGSQVPYVDTILLVAGGLFFIGVIGYVYKETRAEKQ